VKLSPEHGAQVMRETLAKRRGFRGILVTRWRRGRKETIRLTKKLKLRL